MNLARISFSYLRASDRTTVLNVVLLAFGVAVITLLGLVARQLEERMMRDARGIDLVVGAAGSTQQLILGAVYQLDVALPQMRWTDAQAVAAKPEVAKTIPLAAGDNYQGFRVIGTTPDFSARFEPRLREGRLWQAPLEVVIGSEVASRTGLRVGRIFAAAHGSGYDHEPLHGEHPYTVVGEFRRSNTVLDHVVLTALDSVWTIHAPPETGLVQEPGESDARHVNGLLVQTTSAAAAVTLAQALEQDPALQVASPAAGGARVFSILSIAVDALRGLGALLVIGAVVCVLFALYGALSQRRYDLAIMRALGASPAQLMLLLFFEGMFIAAIGAVAGIVLGHGATAVLGFALRSHNVELTGLVWHHEELWVAAGAIAVGLLAAVVPAWRAHEADIAATLARG